MHLSGYGRVGTVTAGTLTVALPTGSTLDTTTFADTRNDLGTYLRLNGAQDRNAASYEILLFCDGSDANNLYLAKTWATQTTITKATGSSIHSNSDGFIIRAMLPISGWQP